RPGCTSQEPSGRRSPWSGTVVEMASSPAPRPSAFSARTPDGRSSSAVGSARSRSSRSSRVTRHPVRASAPAAASPPIPAPTTTAERPSPAAIVPLSVVVVPGATQLVRARRHVLARWDRAAYLAATAGRGALTGARTGVAGRARSGRAVGDRFVAGRFLAGRFLAGRLLGRSLPGGRIVRALRRRG